MPLFTKTELDLIWIKNKVQRYSYKTSDTVLKEASASFDSTKTYDIFLSHCYKDKDTIAGLSEFLKELGYSVYVDWIDDAQLDRSEVTKETASILRDRMKNCLSLLFVTSENFISSKWMPWELGYFDGKKNKAAILPISEKSNPTDSYSGSEYLGIYPFITKAKGTSGKMYLWVNANSKEYTTFDSWIKGTEPYAH